MSARPSFYLKFIVAYVLQFFSLISDYLGSLSNLGMAIPRNISLLVESRNQGMTK